MNLFTLDAVCTYYIRCFRPYYHTLLLFFFVHALHAQTLVTNVEAESGTRAGGLTIAGLNAGYSGTGYVTNMTKSTDNLSVDVTVPAAANYKMVIRYNGPYGDKIQNVYVNGEFLSALAFPATTGFTDLTAGSLPLHAGLNTVAIHSSWGYTDFDKFTFYTVPIHNYSTVVPALIDPDATTETVLLYEYLRSNYGKKIVSGQTSDYYDNVSPDAAKKPVIRAFDFQHYTVGYAYLWDNAIGGHSFGWEDNGQVQAAIDWYNSTCQKGIVAFQWHWHSPSGGQPGSNTFSTAHTTFDVTKAVTTGTDEYTAIIRDIDSIATQLKKLQKAGVPVLWRPLHEAGGAWFWWGAKGNTAALKLYDIVYDRIINHHKIHNLIWQWSTPEPDWYPGHEKVDMIGYDSYPGSYNYGTQKLIFDQLFDLVDGKKLVAMTENGPIPDPELCVSNDAMWSYFMSWGDLAAAQNFPEHLSYIYNHERVITLDEVPAVVWYADTDGDGKGDAAATLAACTKPAGYVAVAGDACPGDTGKTAPGNCGCGNPETCTTTSVDAAAIAGLSIYPNPYENELIVSVAAGTFTLSLYNTAGIKIQSGTYSKEALIGSELAPGMYLVRIEQNDRFETHKIIKK